MPARVMRTAISPRLAAISFLKGTSCPSQATCRWARAGRAAAQATRAGGAVAERRRQRQTRGQGLRRDEGATANIMHAIHDARAGASRAAAAQSRHLPRCPARSRRRAGTAWPHCRSPPPGQPRAEPGAAPERHAAPVGAAAVAPCGRTAPWGRAPSILGSAWPRQDRSTAVASDFSHSLLVLRCPARSEVYASERIVGGFRWRPLRRGLQLAFSRTRTSLAGCTLPHPPPSRRSCGPGLWPRCGPIGFSRYAWHRRRQCHTHGSL